MTFYYGPPAEREVKGHRRAKRFRIRGKPGNPPCPGVCYSNRENRNLQTSRISSGELHRIIVCKAIYYSEIILSAFKPNILFMVKPLSFIEKLRAFHRIWRYRLNTEKESIRFLLSQNLIASTVVDIGGNRGIYSYWMSKLVGDEGVVMVFEPQPELGSYLESLRLSFQLNNLIIVNKALSSSAGHQNLYRHKVGDGGASLIKDSKDDKQSVKVEVATLDSYFSSWDGSKISFIKCDVEGNELEVFKGAKNILLEDCPTLLFECHHKEAEDGELFAFLVSMGYDGFFFSGNQRVHYSKFKDYSYSKPGVSHRNYVFVSKNNV